jgi:hypothetical protein
VTISYFCKPLITAIVAINKVGKIISVFIEAVSKDFFFKDLGTYEPKKCTNHNLSYRKYSFNSPDL